MVMAAVSFLGGQDGFDDAIGHTETEDRKGVPEPTVKHQVPHIPYPFKTKWEHLSYLLLSIQACAGCRFPSDVFSSIRGSLPGSWANSAVGAGSMGFNSTSCGKIGK